MIDERMKEIGKVIAVSSGKGGVGKSLIATTLALALAEKGFAVGLFDLDFTSPSTHIILGIEDVKPREEKGIIPPTVHGLEYMSIIHYSGDSATPLRGEDVSNALIELLSVTKWGKLDYLVLDMPPGIGDALLDLIRLIRNASFLVVTTSSVLAFETVKKLVGLLLDLKMSVIGIVENMKMDKSAVIKAETGKLGLNFLAEIPYVPELEKAIGNKDKLMNTLLGRKIKELAAGI